MSLKAKLASLIVAFVLLIGLLVVGVLSVKKAEIDLGGTIAFDAKGIEARIELVSLDNGALKAEEDQTGKLATIEIDNYMSEQQITDAFASWKNLKLKFTTEEPKDVEMQLKITNLAAATADNYIDIGATASFEKSNNCKISVANNAGGSLAVIAPGDDATFTITFSVANPEFSASMDGFLVNFNMQKKTKADYPIGAEGLDFSFVNEDMEALQVAWDGDTDIVDVDIPAYVYVESEDTINPVTTIGVSAFEECETLESIIIPNSVTLIDENAFDYCTNLKSLTIPSSVTNLLLSTLIRCESLETIIVAEGNPVCDSRNNCNAIIETATNSLIVGCKNTIIPDTITSIGSSAFSECTSLTSITIPSSVTSIEGSAFSECTSLTSITIPSSVTSIEGSAFDGCTSLESVTIGSGVVSIDTEAFSDCTNLNTVVVDSETIASALSNIEACGGILANATTVKVLTSIVTVGKLNSYVTDNFSEYDPEIIDGVSYTVYGEGLGISCKILTDENGEETDNVSVFWDGQTELTSLIIPETVRIDGKQYTVTNLGNSSDDWGFSGCENLETIILPETIVHIECEPGLMFPSSLIYNKTSDDDEGHYLGTANNPYFLLVKVDSDVGQDYTLHENCKIIGPEAFWGCEYLRRVTISDVTSIGSSAFSGCENLEMVNIPATVKSIGDAAFAGCEKLTTVIIINSEIIASQLDGVNNEDCGGILANATTVKVLTSIVTAGKLNSFVTTNFTKVTTEGEYTVYSKPTA